MSQNNKQDKADRMPEAAKHRRPRRRSHASKSKRAGSGRAVRLTPERREETDASVVALCFWLLAARIVQEAEDNGDLECPDPSTHDDGADGAES